MVQQVKSCFSDVTDVLLEDNTKLDSKIDILTQIQKEGIALEHDRLNFECEKAALLPLPPTSGML